MINISHIHPMLVHFPIVLYLVAVALMTLVLLRHGDLAANSCLANFALAALIFAALTAAVAAFFGDIALDHAVSLGFDSAPMKSHAAFGISTMIFMFMLSAVQIVLRWVHKPLRGASGYIMLLVALLGAGLLIITAYHGGNLVYQIGVNVAPVKP